VFLLPYFLSFLKEMNIQVLLCYNKSFVLYVFFSARSPTVFFFSRAPSLPHLSVYLPLAGKLAYVAGTGDVVVDYTDDSDVAFVEADGAGVNTMDVSWLAGDEAHDIPAAFLALVPDLPTKVLPAPVLSKATRIPAAASRSPTPGCVAVHGCLGVRRPRGVAGHPSPRRTTAGRPSTSPTTTSPPYFVSSGKVAGRPPRLPAKEILVNGLQ
jgi:hypothetical protein